MATYVSIVTWSGCDAPTIDDVKRAMGRRSEPLRRRGLHSLAFLPGERCTAVMVASCDGEQANVELAAAILPGAEVRVECMRFEDEPAVPTWIAREAVAPPERDYRALLLDAIAVDR